MHDKDNTNANVIASVFVWGVPKESKINNRRRSVMIMKMDTDTVLSVMDLEDPKKPELTADERIDAVAAEILERFRPAFEELAK